VPAAQPDAYVNRQYQDARRPAPSGALFAKVGEACRDISGTCSTDPFGSATAAQATAALAPGPLRPFTRTAFSS
jgi:hypothetical protein